MKAGFSLVEVLVALSIFGLVGSGGVALLRLAADNQARVSVHAARTGQVQIARALIAADLSQAGDVASGQGDVLLRLVRRGWENPDAAARPSVQRVEYRIASERLERLSGPALNGAGPSAPQVLIDKVTAARVFYLGPGGWADAPAEGAPPRAVRFDLTVDGLGSLSQLFLTAEAGP